MGECANSTRTQHLRLATEGYTCGETLDFSSNATSVICKWWLERSFRDLQMVALPMGETLEFSTNATFMIGQWRI